MGVAKGRLSNKGKKPVMSRRVTKKKGEERKRERREARAGVEGQQEVAKGVERENGDGREDQPNLPARHGMAHRG